MDEVTASTIGRIERVPLREVWPHEALDFTKWLEENIEVLNEALGLNLGSAEREQSAGDFSVDVLAEDQDGRPVVIENQLGKSDHDHLGKLITYLAGLEADTAVWIVADPRPEHVSAISWLNESSAAAFYLVKVEAVKIGESPPAPLLTGIVGPSGETRQVSHTKKELRDEERVRTRFWTQFLERARQRTDLFAGRSPGHGRYIDTRVGPPELGLKIGCYLWADNASADFYIYQGPDTYEESVAIFDALHESKAPIEESFGGPLRWERRAGPQACRIRKEIGLGGYRHPEENWPEIQDAMIDAMIRLEKALGPHIGQLDM